MKKIIILTSLIAILILTAPAGLVLAVDTSIDLGTEGSGLLPPNPFYFLKEWGRGFRKFFTPSPVKKAELELEIVNEKAAELQKLDEITPDNADALKRALETYNSAVAELNSRLEALQNNSNDANVDKLLTQLTDRALKHQQLFESLVAKAENEDIKNEFRASGDKIGETAANGIEKLDLPEKLKDRFASVLGDQKDQLKELRAAELVDRLEEKLSGDHQKTAAVLKEDLLVKFSGRLEGTHLVSPTAPAVSVEEVTSDTLRRLEVLDEVRELVVNPDLKSELNVVRQKALEKIEETRGINQDEAAAAIADAQKLIKELESKIKDRDSKVKSSVKELLDRAKFNLSQAQHLFDQQNYGGAFGQATAASAAAKNGLVQLLPDINDNSGELNAVKNYYDSLAEKIRQSGITKEENPRLFELLTEAERRTVELSRLIETKAAQESIAAALRNIKMLLATIEQLLTATSNSLELSK